MKILRWFTPAILFFLLACQPQTPASVAILDGGQIHALTTNERAPRKLIVQAGIALDPADRVLFNGNLVSLDQPMAQAKTNILQVLRAQTIAINGQTIQTTASTVGEAIAQTGLQIYAADQLDPPANATLTNGAHIKYVASRELTVNVDGKQIRIRSSAGTIGGALAEAGIALIGLDSSQPSENEALPQDGQIRIVRISESLVLAQKSIPFKSDFQSSPDVELDQQQILQPGQPGLAVSRVRIRYQDGVEVSRQTESETVARPPKDRVIGYGTKPVVHATSVDGVQIQYWRAVQVYATSYSPCRSDPNRCYPGTSSGLPVRKGVVAVNPTWYSNMAGQQIYVTGYGKATIADVCGGCVGKLWIDLGYSDNDYVGWGSSVTIYFLTPVPPNILYVLQ